LRISKIIYEYDSFDELNKHLSEMEIQKYICLYWNSEVNRMGQFICKAEYINNNFE